MFPPIWQNLASKAPPRLPAHKLAIATLTATAALLALVGLGRLAGTVLFIPPMAASMALIAGAPALPLSQPRHVVGGQLISATIGVTVGLISHSLWAAAIAGGLSVGAMLLTRTSHSPAAATAAIGATLGSEQMLFVACAGIAAAILVAFGLTQRILARTPYPSYWW